VDIPNLTGGIKVYEESPASPSETWAFDGSRSSRSFFVSAPATPAVRYAVAKAFLGFAKVLTETDGSRPWLHRQLPYGDPPTADDDLNPSADVRPFLWCKSLPGGSPVGLPSADPATGSATYRTYKVAAELRTVPYRVLEDWEVSLQAQAGPLAAAGALPARPDEGDALRRGFANTRYITREIEHGISLMQLKEAWLYFEAEGGGAILNKSIPMGVPLPQYTHTLRYTWWEVPLGAVPRGAIAACSNCVSGTEFDGHAAGTLRFMTAQERVYNSPLGPGLLCDVTYALAFLPNTERREVDLGGGVMGSRQLGWNSIPAVLRPADGGTGFDYYRVVDETGKPPYASADFSALFRPGQT
jgi:hypothetical protein